MNENQKDYYVKNIESSNETNIDAKIRNNKIFAVAAFLLAGVAFGIGDELFNSVTLQNIVAFASVGVSCANIRALKENKKIKKAQEQAKQYSKGSK